MALPSPTALKVISLNTAMSSVEKVLGDLELFFLLKELSLQESVSLCLFQVLYSTVRNIGSYCNN